MFSSGPLILTFAKVPAEMGCEWKSRTTADIVAADQNNELAHEAAAAISTTGPSS